MARGPLTGTVGPMVSVRTQRRLQAAIRRRIATSTAIGVPAGALGGAGLIAVALVGSERSGAGAALAIGALIGAVAGLMFGGMFGLVASDRYLRWLDGSVPRR